ncbi:hypothetical protein EDC96DRAFT_605745 [Choanephora cucurbitarum]|nr:hypothetical protein EDC96DRAFT_605745 [Choanephora cucurbitarum]
MSSMNAYYDSSSSVHPSYSYYNNTQLLYSLGSPPLSHQAQPAYSYLAPSLPSPDAQCSQNCCSMSQASQYEVAHQAGSHKFMYYMPPSSSTQLYGHSNDESRSNMLQDDSVSIIASSDMQYNSPSSISQPSPSLLSVTPPQNNNNDFGVMQHYYSTPSPQMPELSTYNTEANMFAGQQAMESLFAPVYPSSSSSTPSMYTRTKGSKMNSVNVTEKRHICRICNHRSKRRHNLIEHMLTHDPNRPKSFSCSVCSRPFARKYDMKRHEKIHRR